MTYTDEDRELMRYRVLATLRTARAWLKRSELSEGVMRHMPHGDRDIVLYAMVRDGLIDEAVRRRAHGPGAPARCYHINKEGRKSYAILAKKYRDGVYHAPRRG